MNWRFADNDHVVIDDSLVDLPKVSTNMNVNVVTTIALDGLPLEIGQAVRVLLVQRAFLTQENADLKERVAELERAKAA